MRKSMINKLRRWLFVVVSSAALFGCSLGGGSSGGSTQSNGNYGNLQGSAVSGPSYDLATLQSFLINQGVCYSISEKPFLCTPNKLATDHATGFNVANFVTNNPLGVTSVKGYKIQYLTPGAPILDNNPSAIPLGLTQTVSGAILIPDIPKDKIKGVVLYFHPTTFAKTSVPSNFDDPSGAYVDQELAAVYGSQGYIVIAPDYVGQGVDTQVMHPYAVYPDINAISGIYMLKALRQFLDSGNIDITRNLNLYISSYSEGGPYALWASKLIQDPAHPQYGQILRENKFDLKRTVGISGAYDITNVVIPFGFTNIVPSWDSAINPYNVSPGGLENGPYPLKRTISALVNMAPDKVILDIYAFTAYIYYQTGSTNINADGFYTTIINPNYFNLKGCLDLTKYAQLTGGESYAQSIGRCSTVAGIPGGTNILKLLNSNFTENTIIYGLLSSAFGTSKYVTGGYNFKELTEKMEKENYSNNTVVPLVNSGIPTDQTVMSFVRAKNIYAWTTNSPVSLIYLKFDSVVSNLNSMEACGSGGVKGMSPNGMVDCVEFDNTKLEGLASFGAASFQLPVFIDHGGGTGVVLQLMALKEMDKNP